jgi:hypothetical protein
MVITDLASHERQRAGVKNTRKAKWRSVATDGTAGDCRNTTIFNPTPTLFGCVLKNATIVQRHRATIIFNPTPTLFGCVLKNATIVQRHRATIVDTPA